MSRTVVVGASSGLGRCIAIGLAQRGDQVALLARRRERIEAAAQEAGSGAIAVECDITDQASCRSAIGTVADAFGGIDNVVYTPAISPLVRMVDTDAETWRRVFDTNVIGASLVTAAAMPHLTASAGKVVYLSSDAGPYGPPWPGLGAYGVSKAALERLVEAWRAEHPDVGFTNLIVGECAGGDGHERRMGYGPRHAGLPVVGVTRLHARQVDARRGPDRGGTHDPEHELIDIDAARGRQGRAGRRPGAGPGSVKP